MFRIAVIHNLKPEGFHSGVWDRFVEYDEPETINAICASLAKLGVEAVPVTADRRLPWRLSEGDFDFVFNIAEFEGRRSREAIPAAICELLDLPYTGSDPLTLALALDKTMAKRVVGSAMPMPRGVLIDDAGPHEGLDNLRYPVIVKPNDEGSSKGMFEGACIHTTPARAVERAEELIAVYGSPVLVEEFLSGPELTVGVRGNGPMQTVLGVMEIAPSEPDPLFVYSAEAKRDWRKRVRYHNPPRLPASVLRAVEHQAMVACRLLGCRDLARVDFRLDAQSVPHFIECNPLPGLHPESGDIVILSRNRIAYDDLVQGLFLDAVARNKITFIGP